MTITIKIKGLDALKEKLKDYSEAQIKAADEAVTTAVFHIEGEVKASVAGQRDEPRSVDTGNFMSSVTGEKTGVMQGQVYSDVEYAGHLENGTSRMAARNHFRNTAARNAEKVREFIANKIKETKL